MSEATTPLTRAGLAMRYHLQSGPVDDLGNYRVALDQIAPLGRLVHIELHHPSQVLSQPARCLEQALVARQRLLFSQRGDLNRTMRQYSEV